MFDLIFPKYKSRAYNTGNSPSGNVWAIMKRTWLCFYKPMTHTKSVWKRNSLASYHLSSSHEILMFGSEEDVESEIDRLDFGEAPITRRVWKDHRIVEEEYGHRQI